MELSIIIVNYNTKNLTLECIDSIYRYPPKGDYEVIVVDNGSSDGGVAAFRKLKTLNPKLKIIENNENVGFAKANNQGIKIAKGEYLLLLNSDTKVTKGAIEEMVKFARVSPDAGAVAAKLLNPDGSVQASVFRFPTIWRAIRQYWLGQKGLLDKLAPADDMPIGVESAVMAAFLITPAARQKAGLLDEKYFFYFEDFDYCRRLATVDLKVYYLPNAKIYHYHGASGKNLADGANQWRRLIPSSKIYHGLVGHYIFNFILWSAQKWKKLLKLG